MENCYYNNKIIVHEQTLSLELYIYWTSGLAKLYYSIARCIQRILPNVAYCCTFLCFVATKEVLTSTLYTHGEFTSCSLLHSVSDFRILAHDICLLHGG